MKAILAGLFLLLAVQGFVSDTWSFTLAGNGSSNLPTFSRNMRYVLFATMSTNLAPNLNGKPQLCLKDLQTGQIDVVSLGQDGLPDPEGVSCTDVAVSDDGRFVMFPTFSALDPNDLNNAYDIYLRDRQLGTTTLVSHNPAGMAGNGISYWASMSADGRFIAFQTGATDIIAHISVAYKALLYDRLSDGFEVISVDSNGKPAIAHSGYPSISADGRFVVFSSESHLDPRDTNVLNDVYVRDRLLGITELCSISTTGKVGNQMSGAFYHASISDDGRYVAFQTTATNLVPNDTNGFQDILLRDRQLGTTERVSVSSDGSQANSNCAFPRVSNDGRFVAFTSAASNLVPGDANQVNDVFIRDRLTTTTERISVGRNGEEENLAANGISLSPDGSVCAFASGASNLVDGDTNGFNDVFIRVLDRGAAKLSGTVQLDGASKSFTDPITFRVKVDGTYVGDQQVTLGPSGEFGVTATRGIVELSVKPGSWLRRTMIFDARGGDQSGLNIELTPGDANGDNTVDREDITAVLGAWGTTRPADDLNIDGSVDLFDVTLVLANFGAVGDD